MAATQKKRLVYWLTEHAGDLHRTRALELSKRGFAVQFFNNLEGLVNALAERRVGIIVVGDEGPSNIVEKNLSQLMSIPEIQGVRLLLSVSEYNENISMLAACNSFRDLLPIDLDEKQWMSRFVFATARNRISMQEPFPQVSFNQLATISLPGRLVWISDRRLLLEAKLRPDPGTSFHLSGPFVRALGLNKMTIVVEECRRHDLIYRFSDAVVARWNVPQNLRQAAATMLAKLRQTDFGPRCKVFMAIQDKRLRARLVKELDPLRFEVNVALQKQSIIDEPKYFSPQIVFIEDKLCGPSETERFRQMLDNLSAEVPVYVLGNRVHMRKLQSLDPTRTITQLTRVPDRLTDAIFSRFLPPNSRRNLHADEDAVNITPDHPYSLAEVTVSARLLRAHPRAAKIAVPVQIDAYGLCKIDSPVFSRYAAIKPYAKILESYSSPKLDAGPFNHIVETYLCDVPKDKRQKLGSGLANLCVEHLSEQTLPVHPVFEPISTVSQSGIRTMSNLDRVGLADEVSLVAETGANKTQSDDVVAEIVQDIAEAVDGLFAGIKKVLFNKNLLQFFIFVGIVSFLVTVIYMSVSMVAPKWNKSGGHYTDQLRNFAPHKFEERRRQLENEKK